MRRAQNVGHFAIECDDVERARVFYEAVFGWEIRPWGPPAAFRRQFGQTPARMRQPVQP